MFKISWSDGLAIAGGVLTLVLIVLDKAGKLKGSMLLVLLAVAGILTLPLMLNVAWVSEAHGAAKFSRGLLMFFIVGLVYSIIAVWVSPNITPDPNESRQDKKPTPKPIFRVEVPAALPGVVDLDVNVFRTSNSTDGSIFPVVARFENSSELGGFSETDTAWARITYKETAMQNLELARSDVACWVDQPIPDITFPFGKARYLLLGGWDLKGKQHLENEFRVFEYSRELHRATEKSVKMAAPRKLLVEVSLSSAEHPESVQNYRFELSLLDPAVVGGRFLSGRYSIRQLNPEDPNAQAWRKPRMERKGTRAIRVPIDPETHRITSSDYKGERITRWHT